MLSGKRRANELKTKLSKIHSSAPVHGKTRPSSFDLTRMGSTLSREEPPLFREVAGPLIARHTTYLDSQGSQTRFGVFYRRLRGFNRLGSAFVPSAGESVPLSRTFRFRHATIRAQPSHACTMLNAPRSMLGKVRARSMLQD